MIEIFISLFGEVILKLTNNLFKDTLNCNKIPIRQSPLL